MKLKEAFDLVPKSLYGSPAVVFEGKKELAAMVFASLRICGIGDVYSIVNENIPFDVLNDLRKTIIFHVKKDNL